jgi:hypothetical protein
LKSRTQWADDSIAGSDECNGHELELEAIDHTVTEIRRLAAQFGDPGRYSDGRVIESRAEIVPGFVTCHVWHPDPNVEEPASHRGLLLSDPGVPSPGIYEVSTDPATQDIHIRVVRIP